MSDFASRLRITGYEITGDPKMMNDYFGITDELEEILRKYYEKVQRKKNSAIPELHDLIEKYPHVPQFKNQLSTLYAVQGNITKANEVNNWLLKEHPDYLFGKLNRAGEYIAKGEYAKVPELLGEYMDIKELYPQRNVFHTNEVASFNRIALLYFTGIKDLKAAEMRLDVLRKIDDPFIDIKEMEKHVMALRMEKAAERWQREHEFSRSVKAIAKKVTEPASEKPVFTHPQVEQLYCNGMRISPEIINEILSLPRETLIADLHKVIYDSMARLEHFRMVDWDETTHEFPVHALFLLTELKSEESLQVTLDILRQDEEYLDYWFGDFLTEMIWETIYTLGFHQLDALSSYLKEPDRYCYARCQISEAVSRMALHHPERRQDIIKWYEDLLCFFLAEKENDRILDTGLLGLMTGDLLDIRATELEPLIQEVYHHRLADESSCGPLEEVLEELHNRSFEPIKRELYPIIARYGHILKSWYYSDEEEDLDFDEDDEEYYDDHISLHKPAVRSSPKIGRNEPCPCGSGLKYKKCHGNE